MPATPTRALASLTLGHFAVDGYPAMLYALLPMLIRQLGISFAFAGAVVACLWLTSSVGQLLVAHFFDRRVWTPLASLGVLSAAVAMSCIGVIHTYGLLLVVAIATGLGVAAFHPPAVIAAARCRPDHPQWALGVFFTGGSAGVGFMAVAIVPIVSALGSRATLLAILPGALAAGLLFKNRSTSRVSGARVSLATVTRDRRVIGPLITLIMVTALRSAAQSGYASFLPTFFVAAGRTKLEGSIGLAVFMLAGSLGSLVGGPAARRIGAERFVFAALTVGFCVMLPVPGLRSLLLLVPLSVGAFLIFATEAQVTLLAQELLPDVRATASSLMMGLGLGLGGLGSVITGVAADRFGLRGGLTTITFALGAAALAAGLYARQTGPSPGLDIGSPE